MERSRRVGPAGRTALRAERPRERLETLGPEALSDAELLALLLRTGSRGAGALALAAELLARHGGLRASRARPSATCAQRREWGPPRARRSPPPSRSAAGSRRGACAPASRFAARPTSTAISIRPCGTSSHERFLVVLLDGRHRVLRQELVSQGTLTASLVHPREVFRPALREAAAALILVHNHPSGDPTPSREDREVTVRLMRAGEILGVPVLDHVVVAERGYCSLREDGGLETGGGAASDR